MIFFNFFSFAIDELNELYESTDKVIEGKVGEIVDRFKVSMAQIKEGYKLQMKEVLDELEQSCSFLKKG